MLLIDSGCHLLHLTSSSKVAMRVTRLVAVGALLLERNTHRARSVHSFSNSLDSGSSRTVVIISYSLLCVDCYTQMF